MRKLLITSLLLIGLVLVLPNNVLAWTHCGTPQAESDCPTGTPRATQTPHPTHTPRVTPTATPSATPTATPSATPTEKTTATPEATPRRDITSNLSDCKGPYVPNTGCQEPTPVPTITSNDVRQLPSTGSNSALYLFAATITGMAGFLLKKLVQN